jgi:hypothetical protein
MMASQSLIEDDEDEYVLDEVRGTRTKKKLDVLNKCVVSRDELDAVLNDWSFDDECRGDEC